MCGGNHARMQVCTTMPEIIPGTGPHHLCPHTMEEAEAKNVPKRLPAACCPRKHTPGDAESHISGPWVAGKG